MKHLRAGEDFSVRKNVSGKATAKGEMGHGILYFCLFIYFLFPFFASFT